jgi:drug/metabolite transporter (DMT)-like permease
MKVAVQMVAAGIAFMVSSLASGEISRFHPSQVSGESLAALVYLAIFGSLVAYMAYMWLLSVKPASLVGTYAYVNPVVAVFLGWLIAGEEIRMQQGIGLCIIILGLIVVNLSKEKKTTLVNTAATPPNEGKEKARIKANTT